jgi:hypothetical protein
MKIHLHIERLVLEGLPTAAHQGAQVQCALERELARLLAVSGLSQELRGGIAVPSLPAAGIEVHRENHAARLGREVARAVHGAIGDRKRT